jgi:NAD+ kinase
MTQRFRHAAIVGKPQAQGMRELLDEVAHFLLRAGLDVSLDAATAQATGLSAYDALSHAQIGAQCDLAVVVGGDGTMLGIARELARHEVPLVGINQGRLGFITDVPVGQWKEALAPVLAGQYEEEHRSMMDASVWREQRNIFSGQALNDVVVSRGGTSGMVEVRVDVGAQFVANLRADGLIIASPTGSTAYALSAGGPILHPSISGWVLVPIASHTLSNRPIVLPDREVVHITVVAGKDVSVNFDMQGLASLMHGDEVRVAPSAHRVRFLHPIGWSYYATLRKKLHWYEGAA